MKLAIKLLQKKTNNYMKKNESNHSHISDEDVPDNYSGNKCSKTKNTTLQEDAKTILKGIREETQLFVNDKEAYCSQDI